MSLIALAGNFLNALIRIAKFNSDSSAIRENLCRKTRKEISWPLTDLRQFLLLYRCEKWVTTQ